MKRLLSITLLALLIPIGMRAQEATLTVNGTDATNPDALQKTFGETVTFDAATNTLTLSNNAEAPSGPEFGAIESSLTSLTIVVNGSVDIQSITSSNEDATLTIKSAGATTSNQIFMSNEASGASVISGFASVALDDMYWQYYAYELNPPIYRNKTLSNFDGSACYMVTIQSTAVEYPYLWVNNTPVSEQEQSTAGDGWEYNVNEKTLTLNGEGDLVYPIVSNLDELTVVIQGSNQITLDQGAAFVAYKSDASLVFESLSEAENVLYMSSTLPFEGFSHISYENDLILATENGFTIRKKTAEAPVVQPTGVEDKVVTMGGGEGLGADIEDSQSSSVVAANGVYYSLGENDGYYQETPTSDKLVMLTSQQGSVPTDEPGTTAFNDGFKGIVLRVPAGKGEITVNAMINGEGVLKVQVGGVHKTFKDLTSFMDCVISYASTKDCWAYIFNSASETPATSRHRAPGKKMPNTIGIKSVSVSARRVASAPPPSMSPKALTKAMVAAVKEENHIAVSDKDVTSIASDAFDGQSDITYVDLSGTSIAGVEIAATKYSLGDATVLLLPAGNTTAENTKNVVIGGVCEDLLLDDSKNFEIPSDFTAVKVAQKREYTADKNSTVCLPYALDETQASALGTFYEPTAIASGTVTMTSVTKTKANVPYMLKAKGTKVSAEMVEVKKPTGALAGTETRFVGTYSGTTLSHTDTKQYYCFTTDGTFIHVETDDVHVKPFRAYIALNSALGRSLDIDFGDGTTGIKNLKVGVEDNVYYDLQGRRVLYPKKGIYILNGTKVIIK